MAKKVFVSDLSVTMELKNNGVTLQVDEDEKHRGYLNINKGYITWYKGKEHKPRKRININKFIEEMEEG